MDPLHLATLNIRDLADRRGARLAFDRPDPEDSTLFPSGHLGIAARLEIG